MLAKLLSVKKEQDNQLRQYLSRKNPDEMKRRIAALPLYKASASVEMQPLIPEEDLHLPSAEDVLKYSTLFDSSFLEGVQDVYQDPQQIMDHLAKRRPAEDGLKKFKLTDCLPFNDEQQKQPPPPGYIPASVNLKNGPASLKVEHLHSVKLSICSVLQVQPYAVILCGFKEGSTEVDVFVAKRLKQEFVQKALSIASHLHKGSNENMPVSVSPICVCSCRALHIILILRKSTKSCTLYSTYAYIQNIVQPHIGVKSQGMCSNPYTTSF